jgi:hypothetical protein
VNRYKKPRPDRAELPAKDRGRAEEEGGLRTREQYVTMVAAGDPEA